MNEMGDKEAEARERCKLLFFIHTAPSLELTTALIRMREFKNNSFNWDEPEVSAWRPRGEHVACTSDTLSLSLSLFRATSA